MGANIYQHFPCDSRVGPHINLVRLMRASWGKKIYVLIKSQHLPSSCPRKAVRTRYPWCMLRPTLLFAAGERVRKAPSSPERTELPEMTLLGEQGEIQ